MQVLLTILIFLLIIPYCIHLLAQRTLQARLPMLTKDVLTVTIYVILIVYIAVAIEVIERYFLTIGAL